MSLTWCGVVSFTKFIKCLVTLIFFFFFHKNYYQKHFLIFRCREVFKTVLDNQKKPVSITGEYFQEHNSSPRDKRILKTDSLRVCCLECLMLKKRTVSACTLGMHTMWLIITNIALFAFWEKYRVKKKKKNRDPLGGPSEKFYTRRLRPATPWGPTTYLSIYTISDGKGTPFVYLTNSTPSINLVTTYVRTKLEPCIPFNLCKKRCL